jgi:hypothetical protein
MTSHTILLEILKIVLVASFLFLFVVVFKRAILIGKSANEFLTNNYSLEENYKKKLVKKIVLKFIAAIAFDKGEMISLIKTLSLSQEFMKNTNPLKEENSFE